MLPPLPKPLLSPPELDALRPTPAPAIHLHTTARMVPLKTASDLCHSPTPQMKPGSEAQLTKPAPVPLPFPLPSTLAVSFWQARLFFALRTSHLLPTNKNASLNPLSQMQVILILSASAYCHLFKTASLNTSKGAPCTHPRAPIPTTLLFPSY